MEAIVSSVAGIELTQMFDYEIGHINIAINNEQKEQSKESASAFAWHFDSYPFVCVTMLSDSSDMSGGETVMKTPFGEEKKVRGPAMVRELPFT